MAILVFKACGLFSVASVRPAHAFCADPRLPDTATPGKSLHGKGLAVSRVAFLIQTTHGWRCSRISSGQASFRWPKPRLEKDGMPWMKALLVFIFIVDRRDVMNHPCHADMIISGLLHHHAACYGCWPAQMGACSNPCAAAWSMTPVDEPFAQCMRSPLVAMAVNTDASWASHSFHRARTFGLSM